jgi:hypothetical protein
MKKQSTKKKSSSLSRQSSEESVSEFLDLIARLIAKAHYREQGHADGGKVAEQSPRSLARPMRRRASQRTSPEI